MNPTVTPRLPLRNKPRQARAQQRLAEIRVAAEQVLDEVGRDRLTTSMVADRAGCSIGTVYRYFDDRVALLDDLYPNRCEGLDCPRTHLAGGHA